MDHVSPKGLAAQTDLRLIVARLAARLAIEQSIAAEPHTLKAIAQAAKLDAGALLFGAVTLPTVEP
jgi:hypothetical protein